jgi:hypothetical protein
VHIRHRLDRTTFIVHDGDLLSDRASAPSRARVEFGCFVRFLVKIREIRAIA